MCTFAASENKRDGQLKCSSIWRDLKGKCKSDAELTAETDALKEKLKRQITKPVKGSIMSLWNKKRELLLYLFYNFPGSATPPFSETHQYKI